MAVGGDTMFRMLNRHGLMYDRSMLVPNPSWPYTLNYKISHTCAVKPCPTELNPGNQGAFFLGFWTHFVKLCGGIYTNLF